MKYFLVSLLISYSTWAQQSSPVLDPNKYTVCAITINSDDEKKVFDAQVKKHPDKFNPIVELTTMGGKDEWFKKACESKLQCDQLVISGHFGGDFFAEEGDMKLTLEELEKASCSKSCDGILKKPLEVFLFGCNTLSNKDGDSRTPAQYLQVLLNDGIPLARAEMVVESRYGSIGDSHRGIMQRVFSGEKKQIYGFNSIGPSGKNVKGFLNNYFAQVSAPKRLELLESKRLMDKVDMTNKVLATSLKTTAFTQCEAGSENDPVTKNICALKDEAQPIEKRLDLIHELLGQENYLGYLPAINRFFSDHPPSIYNESQKAELKFIADNAVIKAQMIGLVEKTQSLGLKDEWATFAKNVGFISPEVHASIMKKAVVDSFNTKLTEASVNIICSLKYETVSKLDLKLSDFKNKNFAMFEATALGCMNVRDPAILNHAANRIGVVKSIYDKTELAALVMNNENPVTVDSQAIASVKPLLLSKEDYPFETAVKFMARFSPKDPVLKQKVQIMLTSKNEEHRQTAIGASMRMNDYDPKTQKQVISIIKTAKDEYTPSVGITYLLNTKNRDPAFLNELGNIMRLDILDEFSKGRLKNYIENKN